MGPVVLDASVIAALYVEEPLSEAAQAVLFEARVNGTELHAPDLLLVECANALWKRVRRDELSAGSAMAAINDLARLADLRIHPIDARLIPPALSLAMAHGLTAYDAVYVALAVAIGGTVVSGDQRLVAKARERGLPVAAVLG